MRGNLKGTQASIQEPPPHAAWRLPSAPDQPQQDQAPRGPEDVQERGQKNVPAERTACKGLKQEKPRMGGGGQRWQLVAWRGQGLPRRGGWTWKVKLECQPRGQEDTCHAVTFPDGGQEGREADHRPGPLTPDPGGRDPSEHSGPVPTEPQLLPSLPHPIPPSEPEPEATPPLSQQPGLTVQPRALEL